MNDESRALAREITKSSSKQSYFTIEYLADRDLRDDAFRAYAYFRWVDDIVDRDLASRQARLSFIATQTELIERGFAGQQIRARWPEEQMVIDLIAGRDPEDTCLRSYLKNMMAVLEFDAGRRGRLITATELQAYTGWLARGVMDALDYFIDHGRPYPASPQRELAVAAAHVVHMLRDTYEDIRAGFFNIPREVLEVASISAHDVHSPAYRAWVRQRLNLASDWFGAGKGYIGSLRSFRSRLAGYCYCARFETTLYMIKRDHFVLRPTYPALAGLNLTQGLPKMRDWPMLIRPNHSQVAGMK